MTTYYVATLARYVLVEAETESAARAAGEIALRELCGREAPIKIRTVRPATDDEIEFWRWHQEAAARETES